MSTTSFFAIGALAFAGVLFFGSVFLLDLNLTRLEQSFDWVEHTNDVLIELAQIDLAVVDAESGERGYLLTGNSFYLGPYDRAESQIGAHLQKLAGLVSDNADQLRRAEALRPLVERRMREFKRAVDFGPARMADALAIIRQAKELRLTQAARDAIEVMRRNELQLLANRQQAVHSAATKSTILTLVSAILGLASAIFGVLLFMRQRTQHRLDVVQTELAHLSRLNSMGETASAMAHEIKQPLTATRGYLDAVSFMLEKHEDAEMADAKQALDKAAAQVDRAAEIISRLRRYVQQHETDVQSENAASIVEEALALMNFKDSNVTVRTQILPDLPEVLVDRVEIEQVLINLFRNAVEAMAASPRRELEIVVESLNAKDSFVRVSVADTGPGVAPDVASRLFQPFNSTKADGMGVGLSISRSLIEKFGGRIWADSNPHGGMIFRFTMPAADEA